MNKTMESINQLESMYLYLIQKEHTLKIWSIQKDFQNEWVEYNTYFSTDEILKSELEGDDLDIYLRDDDIAQCISSPCVFTSISDLFNHFEQHYTKVIQQ